MSNSKLSAQEQEELNKAYAFVSNTTWQDGVAQLKDRLVEMGFEENEISDLYEKITNKSKFNKLSHKDYLGAIMSLGIEREKFGDLRVIDDFAVVPIYEEVIDYIFCSLDKVGKSPVSVEEIFEENLPKINFLETIFYHLSPKI